LGKTVAPSGALPRTEELDVYARTTTIQADPAKIDAGIAPIREQTLPSVTSMQGCVGMSLLVDRQSGRCIATTAWESEAAMRDSAESVRPLRDEAEQGLGASSSEVDMWEVAVVHRDHSIPDGACARVTWVSVADSTNAERILDTYKMGVLPRLQELDGFCSASMLIDRETGRGVGTVIFDSRQQLEGSRDSAASIRERATSDMGATVNDVAEFEVAFAHLHVPEMV
jgi:heme-degrading monooxygenase HmoA